MCILSSSGKKSSNDLSEKFRECGNSVHHHHHHSDSSSSSSHWLGDRSTISKVLALVQTSGKTTNHFMMPQGGKDYSSATDHTNK